MSPRRPTVALLFRIFRSRSLSDTRLAPSILLWIFFNHMCASWCPYLFVTDVIITKYFGAWLPLVILYPCSWCLRVHSNVLTGLSLAIVLARFLAWRWASRWQPRNLRVDVCSLAKIGVILVSCSCGKWSPIDADVSNRFRPQPLETKCCTPRPQWSCTTYFCTLLGILVSSWCLIS